MDDRTGRPVVCPQGGAHSSQTRFSREHKNVILEEEENHDRTEKPGSSWKYLSLIGDEQAITLQRTRVYVFSDSVLCLGNIHEKPRANTAWEERLAWFKGSQENRNLDKIDSEPLEFEWNIFPGCTTLQLSHKVQELLLRSGETSQNFTGRIIFMSMFNDISWGSKDNKKECETNAQLVSLYAKRFGAGQWSFLGPGSEKKWYSISEDSPQGEWDRVAEQMMVTLAESGHPIFRSTSPLSRGTLQKAKVVENYQYAAVPMGLKLFLAQLFLLISSVFTEKSQICVMNTESAMLEQGDLLWQDNLTHCSCRQVR